MSNEKARIELLVVKPTGEEEYDMVDPVSLNLANAGFDVLLLVVSLALLQPVANKKRRGR